MRIACYPPIASQEVAQEPVPVAATRTLTNAEKAALARFLAKSLKDPGSAQFHWAPIDDKRDGILTYCATVNAKNSYGGYNGFQPYLAKIQMKGGKIETAAIAVLGDGQPEYENLIPDMCRKRESIFSPPVKTLFKQG